MHILHVPILKKTDLNKFRELILTHYRRHGRIFPWRLSRDPYEVAVSEFMLQQTGVERVLKKYPPFIAAFPTAAALAEAPLKEVLALWSGLGYNRRALSLKEFAVRVTCKFAGEVPRDPEVLISFPGIGPYTSCSIPAFAYNLPTVFIDTNIRRVFLHFFFTDQEAVHDREIFPLIEETLDHLDPRTWYSALMDYGTYLKTLYPNPNRRSAHYSRQVPFEGSARQIRGRIVALLSESSGGPRSVEAIAAATGFSYDKVADAARRLMAEGFVAEEAGMYRIAE